MKQVLVCCLLITVACNSDYFIAIDVDNSAFELSKDCYCAEVWATWLPENIFVTHSSRDLTFRFVIDEFNPFIRDTFYFAEHIDKYGFFSIKFYFELDHIKETLGPITFSEVIVNENKVEYIMTLYYSTNPIVQKFLKTDKNRLKIEQFRYIINNCKLYAIKPNGERMDFSFTKETKFGIYKKH